MDDKNNKNEKINKISNPLTMIGVFAGLVEIIGTVVLFNVTEANQKYLIGFIIGFPILLACLFFYVLIRYPQNLYPPSEYPDGNTYLEAIKSKIANTTASLIMAESRNSEPDINAIVEAVVKTVSDNSINIKKSRWRNQILWVDDRPENNIYEREAFENFGYEFSIALSTNQALELIKDKKFAAIISDMGRKEGSREGYVLLEKIRNQGITTPFIIYAGSNLPEHKEEALRRGAQGSTCYAQELFSLVINEINKS